jgi:hypothetical protein
MKRKVFKLWPVLVLVLSFLVLIQPYLSPQFPYTHDGENHLARFANYKIALKEGQFPPRFAPNLMNHYGYPVFNYNYPLANLLSLPFSALKINYELTFKLIAGGSTVLGLIGLSQWLRLIKVKSQQHRLLALSSYLVSPYLVNLIYVRGNIGEIMAINLLPWLGVMVEKIKQNQWQWQQTVSFSLLITAFLLSHNITAVFGMALILVYAAFRFKLKKKDWLKFIWPVSFGLLMSLWFWLPALAEKHLIVLDQEDLTQLFAHHFPSLKQLLFSPLSFGFSFPAPVDSLSFALGKPFLLSLGFSLILVLNLIKTEKSKKIKLFLIAASWILFLLQLKITEPVWQMIPFINYIQFPWRLSLFLTICLVLVTGLWLKYFRDKTALKIIFIFFLSLQVVSVYQFSPADFFHKTNRDYDAFTQSSTTKNENRTKEFTFKNISQWQPSPQIIQGQGDINVISWRGSKRTYRLYLRSAAIVVEPTMNFKGWKTWADGQLIEYLDNETVAGRIAYRLPPGRYVVRSKFTQQTWPRISGHILTLLGLLGLAGYGFDHYRQKQKS